MARITVKIEDYNKLGLVARARLAAHDTNFDARTAHIEDMALAKKKKAEAFKYIADNQGLIKAGALNHIYEDLVVLAHKAEDIAEMRNHTALADLSSKIGRLNFRYAGAFAGLNKLIEAEGNTERGGA